MSKTKCMNYRKTDGRLWFLGQLCDYSYILLRLKVFCLQDMQCDLSTKIQALISTRWKNSFKGKRKNPLETCRNIWLLILRREKCAYCAYTKALAFIAYIWGSKIFHSEKIQWQVMSFVFKNYYLILYIKLHGLWRFIWQYLDIGSYNVHLKRTCIMIMLILIIIID